MNEATIHVHKSISCSFFQYTDMYEWARIFVNQTCEYTKFVRLLEILMTIFIVHIIALFDSPRDIVFQRKYSNIYRPVSACDVS